MDNNRHTKILFWNIRGINPQEKWDVIRDKITESACQILYLQEIKRENFDMFYIKKFCPRNLDRFAFSLPLAPQVAFQLSRTTTILMALPSRPTHMQLQ
jgi:hypothetical protein